MRSLDDKAHKMRMEQLSIDFVMIGVLRREGFPLSSTGFGFCSLYYRWKESMSTTTEYTDKSSSYMFTMIWPKRRTTQKASVIVGGGRNYSEKYDEKEASRGSMPRLLLHLVV